jgi:ADP-heptose:LPS heptosyltransferase
LKTFYILSIKGFGDALISLWAIARFKDEHKFRLVTSNYMLPLISHLKKDSSTIILSKISNYPALYNIKRSNLKEIIKSAWMLNREIKYNCNAIDSSFIFDSFGIREFLIKPFNTIHHSLLPTKSVNIYQNYLDSISEFTNVQNNNQDRINNFSSKDKNIVAIFFSSRVNNKQICIDDLEKIKYCCISNGLTPMFIMHYNDTLLIDIYSKFEVKTYINYVDLDIILQKATCVISSDSFPAHYAEYHGYRVFVINNLINTYYLPYSAYINDYYSVGVDKCRLNKFLLNSY